MNEYMYMYVSIMVKGSDLGYRVIHPSFAPIRNGHYGAIGNGMMPWKNPIHHMVVQLHRL